MLVLLAAFCPSLPPPRPDAFKATVVGLGRYRLSPAIFLAERRDNPDSVLPVPVAASSVTALEQALKHVDGSRCAMLEVLVSGKHVVDRDGGIFDSLPWQWSASAQAKRDAFARFTGRGYPKEGYGSPYHLLLDLIRRDSCADVSNVLIENTDLLGSVVLGGCVQLERRVPPAIDSGSFAMGSGPPAAKDERWWGEEGVEPILVESTADEALGLALALGTDVLVERAVWESASTTPCYSMQRGKMRIDIEVSEGMEEYGGTGGSSLGRSNRPPLPWEITSTDELYGLSLEEKALSALSGGLQLPRARDASDELLIDLLSPLLDETVRRELRLRRALESGDDAEAAALSASTSKRGTILAALRRAVAQERYGEAAQLANELRVETNRRADVTQDEGAYDPFLDQDDWYARDLAAARERELQREREEAAQREERRAHERKAAEAEKKRAEVGRASKPCRQSLDPHSHPRPRSHPYPHPHPHPLQGSEVARASEKAIEGQEESDIGQEEADKGQEEAGEGLKEATGGFALTSAQPAFRNQATKMAQGSTRSTAGRFETDAQVIEGEAADEGASTEAGWSADLEQRVIRQMMRAFDNYRDDEVVGLLRALVAAALVPETAVAAEGSLRKLASITLRLEALEQRPASTRSSASEYRDDEARSLLSQLRMWAKDGERYGSDSDPWLRFLEDLRKGI